MLTVLVVDDERQIAQIARDYLEHAGFAISPEMFMPKGHGQRSTGRW